MDRRSQLVAALLLAAVLSGVPGCSHPTQPSSDPGPPSISNDRLCTLPAVAEVWQGGAAPTCLVGGWCASYPPLQGFSLRALSGHSGNDLWAAGDGHLLLHWDGQDDAFMNSPGEGELEALWGPSADDLWGVGTLGTLIHWDGVTWARVCSPTGAALHALSGTAHDDVWAVGDSTLLHFDGQTWSRVVTQRPDFTPLAVFALARDDVWVNGDGRVEHWDGRSWSDVSPPGLGASWLTHLWGTGPSDLWLGFPCGTECGSFSFIAYHWDGSAWTQVKPDTDIVGMWGSSPSDGWGLLGGRLFHWDGTSWQELPSPPSGVAPSGGLVATADGYYGLSTHLIQHVEGGSWVSLGGREVEPIGVLQLVQRTADDAWAVGKDGNSNSFAAHFDGARWTPRPVPSAPPASLELSRITLPGPTEVWGLGRHSVYRWTGTAWDSLPVDTPGSTSLSDLWGFSAEDLWVAGEHLTHLGGTLPTPNDKSFKWVGGTSPTNVWATTSASALWHWDGVAWSQISRGSSDRIDGLWVAGVDDLWVTESSGFVARWNKSSWTRFSTPQNHGATSITGSGDSDVWLAIDGGLAHWDGASWSLHFPPRPLNVFSLTSRAPGEVWIGTEEGILSYKP